MKLVAFRRSLDGIRNTCSYGPRQVRLGEVRAGGERTELELLRSLAEMGNTCEGKELVRPKI